MGRPKGMPKIQISLRLPEDLIERLREALEDPVRNKTKYGSVSDLCAGLLYQWINVNPPKLEDL